LVSCRWKPETSISAYALFALIGITSEHQCAPSMGYVSNYCMHTPL
jgi:hypothetical protein